MKRTIIFRPALPALACTLLMPVVLLGQAGPEKKVGETTVVSAKASVSQLGWMSGHWAQESSKSRVEEHWTDVAGNVMLGVGRTIAGGKTVFFEFLRIEERADGIYYVAQPKGRPGTDFKLTRLARRLEGQEAMFENPAHDFPKRITYRRNADGSITARVDGGADSPKAEEFHYKPIPK